jgi:hypothetical protein
MLWILVVCEVLKHRNCFGKLVSLWHTEIVHPKINKFLMPRRLFMVTTNVCVTCGKLKFVFSEK